MLLPPFASYLRYTFIDTNAKANAIQYNNTIQASLDITASKCIRQCSTIIAFGLVMTLTFDLSPLTLKNLSAMPTHVMNISVKFHSNPRTQYRAQTYII